MSAHLMLDLETLGNGSDAVIVAIGAYAFDMLDPEAGSPFYTTVNPQSCIDLGLRMDASTVLWWLGREDAARAAIVKAGDGPSLQAALRDFAAWLALGQECGVPVLPVWGNGATFDNVILANAYRAAGMKQPWSHRDDRCFRTLKAMYPDVPAPASTGTKHNALDDAKHQALHMAAIFQAAGLK